jgi:hypothetical protein
MKCSQAGARLAAILERELSDCDDWIFSPIYVQFVQLVAGLDMCHEECPLVFSDLGKSRRDTDHAYQRKSPSCGGNHSHFLPRERDAEGLPRT